MVLKDVIQRLLERKQHEEDADPGTRKGVWFIAAVLVLMVGWTLSAQFILPRHERRAEAKAVNYVSAVPPEIVPPPEPVALQQAPSPKPKPQARPEPQPRPTRVRPKQETEEQKLRREARNRAHYAGPLQQVWAQNGQRNERAEEEPPQTLEVPTQRNGATNGTRNRQEIAKGDVWQREFYERSKDKTGVLQPPQSPYMVMRGTVIPLELLRNIDTQTPGEVTARVTQDIRDTATGQYVMIPKDSVIIGRYDTELGYQEKLPSSWDQLNLPNGETMQLASFPGADRTGAAGMEIDLNRHLLRRVGYVAMITLTGAAARVGSYASGGSREFEDALQQQSTREIDRETRQAYSRGRYPGPTGTQESGYRFLVQVSENLRFPGDYYERTNGAKYAER